MCYFVVVIRAASTTFNLSTVDSAIPAAFHAIADGWLLADLLCAWLITTDIMSTTLAVEGKSRIVEETFCKLKCISDA